MIIITGEYRFIPVEKVLYGPGIINRLTVEVDRLGGKKVVLICSNSLYQSSYVEQIKELLGSRLTLVISGTKQHVQSRSLFDIADKIRKHDADLLISLGGGTVIDSTKAIAMLLGESITDVEQLKNYSVKFEYGKKVEIPSLSQSIIPHIAIPTTLSAAEFSNIIGITDEERKVKELYIDDKLTPKSVLLDPNVTVKTPNELWLASGIRSLDHAIETIYSKQKQPITTTLALEAIKKLNEYLPKYKDNPEDLNARLECQIAAWMSFFGVTNVMMGLSHGIGHQIGAHANVSHGVTSCIMLPHVMRFSLSETIEEQALIASALDSSLSLENKEETAALAANLVEQLIKSLDLPTKLSDVNVRRDQFNAIASDAMEDLVVASSPKPASGLDEVVELLNKAW